MSPSKYELTPEINEHDHIQSGDAPIISLVEYGDYQCPHCGRAYPIVKQIQEDLGDQLEFVFRNFPLSQMHEHAFRAAEAAELAGDQGHFWGMHDMLFENQDKLDEIHLIKYASDLGMDPEEFGIALASDAKTERVKSDFMSGVHSGVNGTPSFFINGFKYEGPWDYDDLKAALEEEM